MLHMSADERQAVYDWVAEHVRCRRCGHVWMPRTRGKPRRCASVKCRSPYWDRDRVERVLAVKNGE